MAWVQTRPFKVYEHGGQNTEICKQFTRKIEERGRYKVSVCIDIPKLSFLYVHEVTRVFHDIKSALNSAGNINSYDAVVVFRKLTPYDKPDSSDLYSRTRPLEIPDELPIVVCYWFENNCGQQLCDCEENEKSVKKLVHLIKKDTASRFPGLFSGWWPNLGLRDFWNSWWPNLGLRDFWNSWWPNLGLRDFWNRMTSTELFTYVIIITVILAGVKLYLWSSNDDV
ncbi:uncharacterized protein LOC131705040 [Acipenser ruthenus]|uniref:uncharacterized protein LOC131705040 n=1 Tax=Acipenser ruthenus TaxID=7906 RepID=UPI002741F066|nr:uncharacterized protein LOC131705040 [Acipenser ruthenus]